MELPQCGEWWKVNWVRWKRENREQRQNFGDILCSCCQQEARQVPHTVRTPKQKNRWQWRLLEKILDTEFPNKKDTLGQYWNMYGIGGTLHMKTKHRRLFWVPTKVRDYDRWVHYMTTTLLKQTELNMKMS